MFTFYHYSNEIYTHAFPFSATHQEHYSNNPKGTPARFNVDTKNAEMASSAMQANPSPTVLESVPSSPRTASLVNFATFPTDLMPVQTAVCARATSSLVLFTLKSHPARFLVWGYVPAPCLPCAPSSVIYVMPRTGMMPVLMVWYVWTSRARLSLARREWVFVVKR